MRWVAESHRLKLDAWVSAAATALEVSMLNAPPCHSRLDVVLDRLSLVLFASETCLCGGGVSRPSDKIRLSTRQADSFYPRWRPLFSLNFRQSVAGDEKLGGGAYVWATMLDCLFMTNPTLSLTLSSSKSFFVSSVLLL